MVSNVVHATYTETYDLNTAIGELSILGFHTPTALALRRMYKGFFQQYKKFKINGCSFRMVCASQQSLDPTQLGLEAGAMDPRDVLNPILFKACTGEAINALLDQVYVRENSSIAAATDSVGAGSISQHFDDRQVALDAYYQLLADDSFRKSHPQSGLTVGGLKPYVHRIVSTQPFKWTGEPTGNSPDNPRIEGAYGVNAVVRGFGGVAAPVPDAPNTEIVNPTVFVSNGLAPMPWLDTTVANIHSYNVGDPDPSQLYGQEIVNSVPRVYMGVAVLPPAITQRLFFRLRISWSVSFKDFRPYQDTLPLYSGNNVVDDSSTSPLNGEQGINAGLNDLSSTYFRMYHTPAALNKVQSSFDANGVSEVTTVMEQVK